MINILIYKVLLLGDGDIDGLLFLIMEYLNNNYNFMSLMTGFTVTKKNKLWVDHLD